MCDVAVHPLLDFRSSGLSVSSVLQKPGMDLADTYITFVRQNQDILRDRVNDELYIEKVFDVSVSNINTVSLSSPAHKYRKYTRSKVKQEGVTQTDGCP